MSSDKKKLAKLTVALASVLSLCGSVLPMALPQATTAKAEVITSVESRTVSGGYYYDNLTYFNKEYELGKKFYAALDDMRASGDFKDGKISYSLNDIVSSAQLKAWVEDGDLTVPKAFGAARDSFLMDHPELFYIDMYKIMISAGYSGGKYTGYIDCGRESDIYRDDAFNSEAEVNTAIAAYDAAVKKFADDARSRVSQISSMYNDDCKLAIAANNEIADKVKYDYAVLSDYEENGENAKSIASLAHTAYGALVNKKAVCSGYSFGYKAVLDYLNIPSVVVSGYSIGKDRSGDNTDGNVPHSWNYVQLETADKSAASGSGVQTSADGNEKNYDWFAFDTTWNSVHFDKNKYSAMDSATASEEHMPEAVISSSGYPLNYPALSQIPYIKAIDPNTPQMDVTTEFGGFKHERVCTPSGDSFVVRDYVSYNGKNSGDLASTENLRLAQRMFYMDNGEKKWTDWQDLAVSAHYVSLGYTELGVEDQIGKTFTYITSNVQYYQFAVVNVEPDVSVNIANTTFENIMYGKGRVEANAVYISDEIENPVYGTYTPPPYIISSRSTPLSGTDVTINSNMSEPGNSSMMADSKALNIKLVYDEPLHILDSSKDVEVIVSAKIENALDYSGLVKFSDGKYVHLSKDENGVLNTVEFKFKPSLMFEHNRVGYHFTITNVGSAKIVEKKDENDKLVRTTSDRAPNSAYYVFSRAIIACPKVFGDGRLYLDCCAQPTLVDNSDLAATGFKDENDNSTFSESARSQMMLVVNEVTPQTESAIVNEIDASNNGISKNDIQKSQTYDINLQICGKIAKIPDQSYVRLALGFPEGYGPDDEGVTFKIYHRKHKGGDQYEIEEIPCVVTKFGIVVTVTSFSPYTVVVVPKNKVNTRTITASIDGKGGTLNKDDGLVRSIAEGDSYTYDLTPDQGYKIHKVLLNGVDVTDSVGNDNSLTVEYAELTNNNELEIKYISDEAKVRYEANNIVDPVKVVVPAGTDLFGKLSGSSAAPKQSGKSSNVGLIVGLVLGGVVLVAVAVAAVIIVKKKNSTNEKQPASAAAKSTAARPAARPTTTNTSARPAARPSATNTPARPAAKPTTTNSSAHPAARPTTTNTSARPAAKPTTTNSSARPAARPTTTNSSARPAASSQQRTTSKPTSPTDSKKK